MPKKVRPLHESIVKVSKRALRDLWRYRRQRVLKEFQIGAL